MIKYKESCTNIKFYHIQYIKIYEKKPIWYQISEKNISSAGARTHENETIPEEICVQHDRAWGKCSPS